MNNIERKELIASLRQQGRTFAFIGRELGMSRSSVHFISNYTYVIKVPKPPKPVKYCACGTPTKYRYCSSCRPQETLQGIDRTRELARIRDKYTCQTCGKVWKQGERRFDVHHLNGLCGKKSRTYDKVSEIDGLITVCHKCHYKRHDYRALPS